MPLKKQGFFSLCGHIFFFFFFFFVVVDFLTMAVVVPSDQIPQANLPPQSVHQQGDSNHEAVDVSERKPELMESSQDLDTDYTEKYKKYEADYVRRIEAKYFSKKTLYGGNIFENETTIENELIKSSRWPSTRSYTDPVQSFEEHSRSSSTSAAETSANLSLRKYQSKKSSS